MAWTEPNSNRIAEGLATESNVTRKGANMGTGQRALSLIWKLILFALLIAAPLAAQAAPWAGILDPSRATDWSQAGVTGGIPNRTTICATLNPGATAAQINNAIASCPNGQVVYLNAGTYNLTSSIVINRSDVTLRGQGMSTILNFTGSGSPYYWGSVLIAVQSSAFNASGDNNPPSTGGVPASTIRDFTGTNGQSGVYTQGATVLDLSFAPSGLAVGGTLTLWQLDPPDNTVPNSGYFISGKANNADNNNVSWQGSGQANNSGQQQRARVMAINGNQVTIAPGLYLPAGTWDTARSPKAGWQSGVITGVGLENFRLTRTVLTQQIIGFNVAADSWISGLGIVSGTGGGDNGVQIIDSRNITVRNSWFDPFRGGGVYTTTSYAMTTYQCSGCLIENNIFKQDESPIMLNAGTTGSVIAYNYENYSTGEGGIQTHEEGPTMNLIEGNRATKLWADAIHGNTALNTLFRNHLYGGSVGMGLWAYHRWWNAVGNVINATVYQSVYSDSTKYDRWSGVAFRLGYSSQYANNNTEPGEYTYPDSLVSPSFMRWGNYVTTGGTRWLASEVPTADSLFPNPVPASQTLPASFYLSARPTWWPVAKAWPPIGPDVTGGNISGYSGHAYTIPAEDCYTAAGGTIANFNASTCYGGGDTTPPSVPRGLRMP